MTETLAETYLTKSILGMNPTISPSAIERDGRKQKKAVRDLVDQGLVEETDDDTNLLILPKAAEEVEAAIITDDLLFQLWEEQRRGRTDSSMQLPYVIVLGHYRTNVGLPVVKTLVENPNQVEWYVCRGHNGTLYRVDETLSDAIEMKDLPTARRDCQGSGWSIEVLTLISTPGLRELVEQKLFEELVEHNYPRQLAWGLRHFDILTEEETEVIKNGLDDALGLHIRGLRFSDEKPEEWGNNLQQSTDSLVAQLGDLQKRLAVAIKVQRGVINMGGWDAFLDAYRTALEEALRKREEEEAA